MTDKPKFMPIIRLDFDGVIHSYTTVNNPWRDEYIPDPVTPGFWQWAVAMTEAGFALVVFSSRCKTVVGREAVRIYLRRGWADFEGSDEGKQFTSAMGMNMEEKIFGPPIEIVSEPVPAWVTIDDRGLTFEGSWEKFTPAFIRNFKPWNK